MEKHGTMKSKDVYEIRAYGKKLTANNIIMHNLIDDGDDKRPN